MRPLYAAIIRDTHTHTSVRFGPFEGYSAIPYDILGPLFLQTGFPTPFFTTCVDFAGILSWILLWISLYRKIHDKNPRSQNTNSSRRMLCRRAALNIQGKKKHINIKNCGTVPGLGGWEHLLMCSFGVIPYGEEKHVDNDPPQNPRTTL